MLRKDLIEHINYSASLFVKQVNGYSAMGNTDINIHAEQAFIPILNAIFGLELKNANQVRKNFPAIDLIDEKNGVAFQITSKTTPEKVAVTLQKFIDLNLHEKYPTLYVYILTEKKSDYNTRKIRNIIKDKLIFNIDNNIFDYRGIMARISFISSLETLSEIAVHYEQLSMSQMSPVLQSIQIGSKHNTVKSVSYIDHVKNELRDIIGNENINRIPELPELLSKIADLEKMLRDKEDTLKNYRELRDDHREEGTLRNILIEVCVKAEAECNDIKRELRLEKEAVNTLSINIRRQKEFLDQIDHQQTSERMKEAGRLFEAGEYTMANYLLNYEGRQDYIRRKLEERERQSAELKALADEEVLLALNILRRQDWRLHIQQIKSHFEQSIELGGYNVNAIQYSYFLEDINQKELAVDMLYKTLADLPQQEMGQRAAIWARIGKLLMNSRKEEALKAFAEAIPIYEHLFEKDRDNYEFALADTLLECGQLNMEQSLEEAWKLLCQALMIVGTLNKKADTNMQKLTYVILLTMGSLAQRRENHDQVIPYHKLALYMGALISLDNPQNELLALLEAVRRFRVILGEEKEGPHSNAIYSYALYYFVRIQKWQSQEDACNTARALNTLGYHLLTAHEAIGAGICFKGALRIFRTLDRKGYNCSADISDSLNSVGFFHMIQNNMKARKKALLEALYIRRLLADKEPAENLFKVASLLGELYFGSFIGVPSSQYYKAYPFFDEALTIYKQLDEKYQQRRIAEWFQLLRHRGIFLSKGLDKTDVTTWYKELNHLVNLIPPSLMPFYEKEIQLAIHEIGQLLAKDVDPNNDLFLKIAEDVINSRRILFRQNPEEYNADLLWALLTIGYKLVDIKQWQKASYYLQDAVEMMRKRTEKNPASHDGEIVWPVLKLAVAYRELKEHERSANLFAELCKYFEDNLLKQPNYLDVLVLFLQYLTNDLLQSNQKEKARAYVERALVYLPKMTDSALQSRLKGAFEEIKNTFFNE